MSSQGVLRMFMDAKRRFIHSRNAWRLVGHKDFFMRFKKRMAFFHGGCRHMDIFHEIQETHGVFHGGCRHMDIFHEIQEILYSFKKLMKIS